MNITPSTPKKCKTKFPISSIVLCDADSRTVKVTVKGADWDRTIKAFADALYWHGELFGFQGLLTYDYSCGERGKDVRQALSTIQKILVENRKNIEVCFRENGKQFKLDLPDFTQDGDKWGKKLEDRKNLMLPRIAKDLDSAVRNHKGFRWYRNLFGEVWSGRVLGLEVCKCEGENKISFGIGKVSKNGSNGKPRKRFVEIVGNRPLEYRQGDIPQAGDLLRELIEDRQNGELAKFQKEHSLEARILSGELDVVVKDVGKLIPIIPLDRPPFQFPTRWFVGGRPRFVDCIMTDGHRPWVVELKVPEKGQSEYYRHAIPQAVLYREYIRNAGGVTQWFRDQRIDPHKCEAVIGVPILRSNRGHDGASQLLEHLEMVARPFGVKVVEIQGA